MKNIDSEFASAIKNLLGFLVATEDENEKQALYDRAVELINAHFGTCPRCGFINSGGKFCSECGQELAGEVPEENSNIDFVDYPVMAVHGNNRQILAILETEPLALQNMQKFLARGVSAVAYKRTLERLK